MNAFGQDLGHAVRSLRRMPGFTATVVLTLALGIGANSAIFSVVDAVLLRPLPFDDADRVVNVAWSGDGHLQLLSSVKFQYWRDHARSFDAMATWRAYLGRADVDGDVSAARALAVSRDFLRVLGYTPARGRGFEPAEDAPGGADVAIVSHAMWRTHFTSAADAVGRTIRLNDKSFTIVGVLPEQFAFPYEDELPDVLVPLRLRIATAGCKCPG